MPSGGLATPGIDNGYEKLIRAGFLRPSHSGIFHMLPLGQRVQDKIERLVVRHMEESLCTYLTAPWWTTLTCSAYQRPLEFHSRQYQPRSCGKGAAD